MPSTVMPIITMVANTGFLIEVLVIHMARSSLRRAPQGRAAASRSARFPARRGRGALRRRRRLDQRGRAVLQVVEARAEHGEIRGKDGLDLDQPVVGIAPAERDDASR